jgi:stalled ribosome alternative rescue factor ArfA
MISKDLAAGTYFISVRGDGGSDDIDYGLASEFEEKIINLDPESAGSYYGLVKDKKGKMIGSLTITITQDGAYSCKLDGINRSKRFFKGFIKSDYSASASTRNIFWRLSTIGFSISQSDSGYYRITGHFQKLSDAEPNHFFYGLRKSIYNANNPLPWSMRGRYTMLMPSPSTTDEGLPAGDGFAVGNMWRGGVLKLWGYSNSGAKFSYSNPMLEGNEVIFFTRPYGGLEALLGKVWFRNWRETDFKGKLRYARKPKNGTYYPDKFDKVLTAEGSRYRRPSTDELPLNSFSIADNNAVAEFVGGVFDRGRYSLTWNVDGSMKTTSTPTYRAWTTFNNTNGRFDGKYIVSPSNESSPEITTLLRGVVLQKKGVVSGQAETEDNGVGRYSIVPNP